jgi:hypothetical protein
MTHAAQIRCLARVLIAKHGRAATRVVHKRAQERLRARDYKVVALWAEVAEVLTSRGRR